MNALNKLEPIMPMLSFKENITEALHKTDHRSTSKEKAQNPPF